MTDRPLMIDLFCGAGGAAMGYHRAGFDLLGVDINPQPRYPFDFIQGDVFEIWDDLPHRKAWGYHASPPCQAYSVTKSLHDNDHPDLVADTRAILKATCKPFVIENVPGSPLHAPIQLCGSSFGLRVRKHRLFEMSSMLLAPPCQHYWQDDDPIFTVRNHGKDQPSGVCYVFGQGTGKGDDWEGAMDVDWMTRAELSQAIPPAYTEWIGKQLLKAVPV